MLVERKVDGSKGPKRYVIRNQNQTANFIKWFDGPIFLWGGVMGPSRSI